MRCAGLGLLHQFPGNSTSDLLGLSPRHGTLQTGDESALNGSEVNFTTDRCQSYVAPVGEI